MARGCVDTGECGGVDGSGCGIEVDAIDIKGTDRADGECIGLVDIEITSRGGGERIDGGVECISGCANIISGEQAEICGDEIHGASEPGRGGKAVDTDADGIGSSIQNITGGGFMLRGLDNILTNKINLPVHVEEDPLKSVVMGTGIALKNYDRFPFVMR